MNHIENREFGEAVARRFPIKKLYATFLNASRDIVSIGGATMWNLQDIYLTKLIKLIQINLTASQRF